MLSTKKINPVIQKNIYDFPSLLSEGFAPTEVFEAYVKLINNACITIQGIELFLLYGVKIENYIRHWSGGKGNPNWFDNLTDSERKAILNEEKIKELYLIRNNEKKLNKFHEKMKTQQPSEDIVEICATKNISYPIDINDDEINIYSETEIISEWENLEEENEEESDSEESEDEEESENEEESNSEDEEESENEEESEDEEESENEKSNENEEFEINSLEELLCFENGILTEEQIRDLKLSDFLNSI
jgi:hypothetical protein